MAGFDNTRLDIEIAARNLTGPAFQQVNAQLEKLNQSAAQSAGATARLEGAMGMLRGAMAALPIALVVGKLADLHSATVRMAVGINDHAEALGLSIRQYQALQVAAGRAGVEEAKAAAAMAGLNVRIGEAVAGKKEAIEAFQALGVKILDVNGKQRAEVAILEEVAQKLIKVEDTAKRSALAKDIFGQSGARLNALMREVAGRLSEVATQAEKAGLMMDKETTAALDKLDRAGQETSRSIKVLYGQIAAPVALWGLEQVKKQIDFIKLGIEGIEIIWKRVFIALNPGAGAGQAIGRAATAWSAPVTVAMPPRPDDQDPKKKPPAGGSADRDRAAEALAALQVQIREVNEAYLTLRTTTTETAKDSIAAADQHMRIETQLAQTLRGIPANDPRRQQIEEQTRALETARTRYDEFKKALQLADQTQARFGDGTREHAETMRLLNEAMATGRLTQDAYTLAVRGANEALQAQSDRAAEARGGMEGLAAGFFSAMRASEKANSTFRVGAELFDQSTRLMSDALIKFAQTGELSFSRLLGSFADMLIQMGLKAAASEVFGAIGDLFGKSKTAEGGGSGGGSGGAGGLFSAIGSLIGGLFAEGGRPPMGKVSLVGERGPELFVPDTAGTVVPNRALGGDGGGSVTVIQHNSFGDGVNGMTRAEILAGLRMAKDAAVAEVYDRKRRGGSYSAAFG